MGDDLHVGAEDRISIGVVVMKMGIDHVADRLVGNGLDIVKERARRSGRGAVVDYQNVLIVDDHYIVAAEAASGVVNTIGNLLELVGFALGYGIRLGIHRDRKRKKN